jgi:hypothetical protein
MVFWNFTVGLKSSVNISSFFFLVFLDFRKLRKVMSMSRAITQKLVYLFYRVKFKK